MNNEVVRVLVTSPLGVGGVTNMMIHIQEHLDRSKINFDYLVFHDRHEPMEDKVLSLGSKKYVASADNVKFRPFRRIWRINTKRACTFQVKHQRRKSVWGQSGSGDTER